MRLYKPLIITAGLVLSSIVSACTFGRSYIHWNDGQPYATLRREDSGYPLVEDFPENCKKIEEKPIPFKDENEKAIGEGIEKTWTCTTDVDSLEAKTIRLPSNSGNHVHPSYYIFKVDGIILLYYDPFEDGWNENEEYIAKELVE